MADPPLEQVSAWTPDEIPGVMEILKDQVFRLEDVRHDAASRTLQIFFPKKFPPRKGLWLLQVKGVRSWVVQRTGKHETDTLRAIEWDGSRRRLSFACVLDRMEAEVDDLDLRLGRLDRDEPAKVTLKDLPEWFQREVAEEKERRRQEFARVVKVRKDVAWKAAACGAVLTAVLGLASGTSPLVALLIGPLLAGTLAWYCLHARLSPQSAAVFYGLPGGAIFVLGGANHLYMFFAALLQMTLGMVMVLWLRDEQSLKE